MKNCLPDFRDAKVAFVILAWNSENYIRNCLNSVLSLMCQRLEVWVVNNGSVDQTKNILHDLSANNPCLHVINSDRNLGTTKSRNIALKRIQNDTDYICILDSDTKVNQAAFDELARRLHADNNIGVVGPAMMNSSGDAQLSGRNIPNPLLKIRKIIPFFGIAAQAERDEEVKTPIVNGLQDVGYLLSACWLMPYSSLQIVGLFDEKIFYAPEDIDWCVRCHKCGLRVCFVATASIIHEYQQISHQKFFSRINLEHLKGLIYFYFKNRQVK